MAKIRKIVGIVFFGVIILALALVVISFIFTGFFGILISIVLGFVFIPIEIVVAIVWIMLTIVLQVKKKKYGFVVSRKDMNYRSLESLERVEKICKEADLALNVSSSQRRGFPMIWGVVLMAGVLILCMLLSFFLLSTVGVAGLSAAGITSALAALGAILGGGMVGGIFFIGLLIAIPPLVVGIVYFSIREYKFKSEKESLYKEAIKKQQAIIRALQEEQDASKDRIEYLNELNILLRRIIKELREDQGEYGAA